MFCFDEDSRQLAHEYLQCCFSDDYRRPFFVVAEQDGEIIGSAAFSEELFSSGVWGVSWVCVHEDHRNQMLGRKLVEKCCDEIAARIEKPVNVILCTYPDKTGLYDKAGFEKAGQDIHGGWFMTAAVEPRKDE